MIDNKQTFDMNRQEFLSLIDRENVNFTEAQSRFVQRIRDGWSYRIKNAHHMSGGEGVWISEDGYEEYGGRFFQNLKNVYWAVRNQTGVEVNFNEWLKIK